MLMVMLSGSLVTCERPLSTREWERCGAEAEMVRMNIETGVERRKSR